MSPTNLTATGSDVTSGLSSIFLSVDNGAWISSTTLNEGVYNVDVRAEDNAGNLANSSTTISVDTTTPSIGVSLNGIIGNNGWYSSSMAVTATASDVTSGIASLEVSADGGIYVNYNFPIILSDGYHALQFKAMDKAGNETETPVQEFYVDTMAPVVDLPAEWEANDTITYKVQDDGSGLSALRIVIEDEDEKFAKVAWDEVVSGNKFKGEITWNGKFKDGTATPPGEYLVWVKVTDVAGNERVALGRVIVPQPASLFNLLPAITASTETPLPPADLFDPVNSSANVIPQNSSFGGSPTTTKEISQQSLSLASGTASASASTTTNSNILWGTTAAAMLGALTAYILDEKRKREEEKAREAQEQERRAKMKAQKMAKLEAQWAQERMWEQARLEQQAKMQQDAVARMETKMERIEAEEDARWAAPQVTLREQAEVKKKAEASQAGLAAYYNSRKQSETSTPTQQQSWWDKTKSFIQETIIQPVQSTLNTVKTTVKTAWNKTHLFVQEKVFQPAMDSVQAKVEQFNQTVYQPNIQPLVKKDAVKETVSGKVPGLAKPLANVEKDEDCGFLGIKCWPLFKWFFGNSKQPAPTPDVSAIQTQAVQTAIAQFSQTAQAMLTPTPTAMPTFTSTPSSTSLPGIPRIVLAEGLNLRVEPSAFAASVFYDKRSILRGSTVYINPNQPILIKDGFCWVSATYIDPSINANAIAVSPQFLNPLPDFIRLTTHGASIDYSNAVTGWDRKHIGNDLIPLHGEDPNPVIRASAQGIVTASGVQNKDGKIAGYGNYVIIEYPADSLPSPIQSLSDYTSGYSLYAIYAHLLNDVSSVLIVDSLVNAGTPIGNMGKSGNGGDIVHLHIELRVGEPKQTLNASNGDWYDPQIVLPIDPALVFTPNDTWKGWVAQYQCTADGQPVGEPYLGSNP